MRRSHGIRVHGVTKRMPWQNDCLPNDTQTLNGIVLDEFLLFGWVNRLLN